MGPVHIIQNSDMEKLEYRIEAKDKGSQKQTTIEPVNMDESESRLVEVVQKYCNVRKTWE